MVDFNYIKQQFLSLQIPHNEHYLNRYIRFILSLPEIKRSEGYGESHHVLPESMFPQYRLKRIYPWNQKRISARSHYICHWLLWKAFRNKDMSCAFYGMSNQKKAGRTYKINSKAYIQAKDDARKSTSEAMKKYNATPEGSEQTRLNGQNVSKKRWAEDREALMIQVRKIWTEDKRTQQSDLMKERQNRPWKHHNSDLSLYSALDMLYDTWNISGQPGPYKFGNMIKSTPRKCQNMLSYFKLFGDPRLDEEWLISFR